MRIAILSDIHGSWPALQAVLADIARWKPDYTIVNGDVINRGPRSADCWRLLAEYQAQAGWLITMGNHEEYVLHRRFPDDPDALSEFHLPSRWTFEQFSADEIETLLALPSEVSLTAPDGSQLVATHASRQGNRDGLTPWSTATELRSKLAPLPAVFVTSHTHRFFQRPLDNSLLINSGSVGCPLDGEWRTGYAQVTWHKGQWSAELVRLDYDRQSAESDFRSTNFMQNCGPMGLLMYREWLENRSYFPLFAHRYDTLLQTRQIALSDAVTRFLAHPYV